jgi:hypothetical protein
VNYVSSFENTVVFLMAFFNDCVPAIHNVAKEMVVVKLSEIEQAKEGREKRRKEQKMCVLMIVRVRLFSKQ